MYTNARIQNEWIRINLITEQSNGIASVKVAHENWLIREKCS